MIDPEFRTLYEWTTQDKESALLYNLFPPGNFKMDDLVIELSEDHCSILVTIPGQQVPVIAGKLYLPIADYRFEKDTLKLIKSRFQKWDQSIVGPIPDSKLIDPNSATELYKYLTEMGDHDLAKQMLDIGVAASYVPALIAEYERLSKIPGMEAKAVRYLEIAASKYHDSKAIFQLALAKCKRNEANYDAYALFESAAKLGVEKAYTYMGIIMSPLSGMGFRDKNPEKAARLFQTALQKDPEDYIALNQYALLLYNGIGMPKDKGQAMIFQKKALDLAPDLNFIQTELDMQSHWSLGAKLLASISAIVFVAAGAFTCYRMARHRK